MNKYQEALERLFMWATNSYAALEVESKECEDLKALLQELVDKAISAKPVDVQDPTFGDFKLSCPRCKRTLYNVPKYCPNCGQKIDWSEENEE